MFNYELLFLIYDYLINNTNDNKLIEIINFNGKKDYNIIITYYKNKINSKNELINKIINNKYLLNLALINKHNYSIYNIIVPTCYYCRIPITDNSNETKIILKKKCKNNKCKKKCFI